MAENGIVSQYYNLFDDTKGYTELLFRAGKILQSKELNEMQSIIKNQIKAVGDTVLTDGDIIEGCQLVIADDKQSVTMTKGKIYLDGNVRDVPDTQFSITGIGTEFIGVILKSIVITPDEDSSLNDIATGFDNYNQDGAFRLKEYVEVVLNNNSSTILYTLIDGMQLSVNTAEDLTQLDKINTTLARRTFDESGNYKVSGLTISDKNVYDDNYVYATIDAGKAYVRGYEVSKETAQTVRLTRPTSLRTRRYENKPYVVGQSSYALRESYVNRILEATAYVQTNTVLTRGSILYGTDTIEDNDNVSDIVSVSLNGSEYVKGTDWDIDIQNRGGVTWLEGGNHPESGIHYTVVYKYQRTMIEGTDFELITREVNDRTVWYFNLLESGATPVQDTNISITYNFYLCRRDTISLDKNGNILVVEGQPDVLSSVESPSVDIEQVLVLGSVLLKPNDNTLSIINNNTKAIQMIDLYHMLERINDLEYNQAISDLDQEAAAGENATELKGIFTDGFIGLTKADIGYNYNGIVFDCSIDLDNQELTLPYSTYVSAITPDETTNYRVGKFNRLFTAPYSEVTLISQDLASDIIRVNSYNAFPKSPSLKITPEVDNWVDTNTITLQGGIKTQTVTLRRWWYHKNDSWAQSEKALWQSYGFADGGASLGWGNGTATGSMTTVNSIISSAIMYMRQRRVDFVISNLQPYSSNIIVSFNGEVIPVTPSGEVYTISGVEGKIKADAYGIAKGYFSVPANTLCGTVEVKAYVENTPSLSGIANYTAEGSMQTTTQTVYTVKTTVRTSDPLAQSFQFDQDQFITGVGLYFCDKDITEPITVQIRNMINGYPGTTVYAEKVIAGSQVKYHAKAGTETRVTFDDPVYCNANEQYCFTVLSDSDVDSMWLAETNKKDIVTSAIISKNPYLNGVMFSSSNAMTWTAHQSQDLKFNLYGAKFESTGSIVFNALTDVSLDRIMIMSDESIPTGCTISWQYSINEEEWLPIEVYDDRDLSEIANSVQVRCNITATANTSPAIAFDSLLLCGFKSANEGTYVSRVVPVSAGYNKVKIDFDLYKPGNTNFIISYATDKNATNWKNLSTTITPVEKSSKYKTYTFEDSLSETAYWYTVKIYLTKPATTTDRPTVQNLKNIMKLGV